MGSALNEKPGHPRDSPSPSSPLASTSSSFHPGTGIAADCPVAPSTAWRASPTSSGTCSPMPPSPPPRRTAARPCLARPPDRPAIRQGRLLGRRHAESARPARPDSARHRRALLRGPGRSRSRRHRPHHPGLPPTRHPPLTQSLAANYPEVQMGEPIDPTHPPCWLSRRGAI